ncbi:SbtR family transcriptional regulator [Nocardia sp. NBC_00403]|uniref:SbtR family transcriptional regulator n=1 Tax=Nocardia sp. NBC_00403 TaxID=2975990 RepID=UPI002E211A70
MIDSVVADAAAKKDLGNALLAAGVDVKSADGHAEVAAEMRRALSELLVAARADGVVRADLELADLLALLYGWCTAAEHYGWDSARRDRALAASSEGLMPR